MIVWVSETLCDVYTNQPWISSFSNLSAGWQTPFYDTSLSVYQILALSWPSWELGFTRLRALSSLSWSYFQNLSFPVVIRPRYAKPWVSVRTWYVRNLHCLREKREVKVKGLSSSAIVIIGTKGYIRKKFLFSKKKVLFRVGGYQNGGQFTVLLFAC